MTSERRGEGHRNSRESGEYVKRGGRSRARSTWASASVGRQPSIHPLQLRGLTSHLSQFGRGTLQYHYLISAFTALENVMMPMLVDRGFPSSDVKRRAANLMEQLNLTSVANNPALNMSGGQQQRVAVARALAMNPDLILADEPTGNLDTKSADGVFKLMRQANQQSGTTFLLVTHNMDLASRCDRIFELVDGRIQGAGEA